MVQIISSKKLHVSANRGHHQILSNWAIAQLDKIWWWPLLAETCSFLLDIIYTTYYQLSCYWLCYPTHFILHTQRGWGVLKPEYFFATNYFIFHNDSNGACSRGEQWCVAIQYIPSSWDYEEMPLKKFFGLLTRGENWRVLPDEYLCFGSETSCVQDWHQTAELNGTYR